MDGRPPAWCATVATRRGTLSLAAGSGTTSRSRCAEGRGNGRTCSARWRSTASPPGPVSWDVAMTATRPDWRVKLKRGDVLCTTATYDTQRGAGGSRWGSWSPTWPTAGRGANPFKKRVDKPGRVTHGHLTENNNHGGRPTSMPDARALVASAFSGSLIDVKDFKYQFGDLSLPGDAGRPPVIQAGQALTFRNSDDGKEIYHSITSCKAPCNRSTGIAYPIADGPVQFESGQLGTRLPRRGNASNGRRRTTSTRAPTRTSAASTRSCEGPSGSSSSRAVRSRQ